MRSIIAMMLAIALVGTVSACGDGNRPAAAANPPPSSGPPPPGPPTDFAAFVTQQIAQPAPAIGTTPQPTTSLSGDLQLDSAGAFGSVAFGTGDALPAGVDQAAVDCGKAGKAACDPGTSADLNSALN